MEEQNDNHSDSDSSESWTLLESSPSYATDALPGPAPAVTTTNVVHIEKDEDTDGISIISDCDSESTCENVHAADIALEQSGDNLKPEDETDFVAVTTDCVKTLASDETNVYDDIIGDASKMKTYVHKRNNKISSMLNVILLGSVITAAGIALGHMWGVRDDCTQQSTPSVNKILSNLYKLQEENAFLRIKLKELTMTNHFPSQQKRFSKTNKCKKIFEEPLNSANIVKTTKCVDPDIEFRPTIIDFEKTELPVPVDFTEESLFESAVDEAEFKNDVKKFQQIYKENRIWLDKEIANRVKSEKIRISEKLKRQKITKQGKQNAKINKSKGETDTTLTTAEKQVEPKKGDVIPVTPITHINVVSYADSLKHSHVQKRPIEDLERKVIIDRPNKKKYGSKHKKLEIKFSDDEDLIVNDKRRYSHKTKNEKPKNDRQRRYKNEKRDNKYEQWEMKGGYMKDYDSSTSIPSLENITPDKDINNNRYSPDFNMYVTYINKHSKSENKITKPSEVEFKTDFVIVDKTAGDETDSKKEKIKMPLRDSVNENWFEKRSSLRRQAREELEKGMPSNNKFKTSRWYFRRMSERELLRARVNNNTQRKSQNRNYKARR